jgi:glucokinase
VTSATLGIDLGGTNLRAGVIDGTGALVADQRVPTPPTLEGIVAAMAAHVVELRAQHDVAACVGIGAAGMITFDGVIRYAPNIPSFVEAPVARLLQDALELPVVLDNDANVAALAELVHGAAQGRDDVLCITLGTGVGGGVITRGQVVRGAHGFAAEVGHFQIDPDGPMCACGERGHWEAMASGTALGRLGRERAAAGEAPSVLARTEGVVEAITGTHVGDAAQEGAPDALAIVHEYARSVALGLVGLVNILDSELVVISGGLVELGDVLLAPVREFFDGHLEGARHRPRVDIVPAALGERAGVVGAAVLARQLIEN